MATNYTLPPWIVDPPNYSESFGRGLQEGAAAGRSFLQSRIAREESARENAFLPLRQKMLDNQVKNTALDIQERLIAQDEYISNKQSLVRLAEAARRISENSAWAEPASEATIWEIGISDPSVMRRPEFRNILQQFDTAGAAARLAKDAQTRAARVEGELGIKSERIALQADQIRIKDEQAKADRESREKIAGEKNAALIHVATLRAKEEARDRLDDIEFQAFKQIAEAIGKDAENGKMGLAEMQRKMQDAMDRAMENSKARKANRENPASPTVRKVFDPSTKTFK